jgi:hypothetical protein
VLYTHRNPGENMSQAVSINGQRYADLPTAFAYRQALNPACSCKAAGETWAHALTKNGDETVQRGDIIVTDDKAKAMQQPKASPARQPRSENRSRNRTSNAPPANGLRGSASAPAPAEANASPTEPPAANAPARPRAIGPQFLPAR